ncbi:MAG: hypothetical protein WC526_04590 [Patescibacteria group bacterium]
MKLPPVIIPFCEGEAEVLLFEFLKLNYSNKTIRFQKPKNLKGFENLAGFKKKYYKAIKAQGLKPKKDFIKVRFLFIFDNDLEDSKEIKEFLELKGHLVQQCEPNVEGLILGIIDQSQGDNLKTEDYRKKCKNNFKKQFGCESHRLKERELKKIFEDEKHFKNNLPILYNLFKK